MLFRKLIYNLTSRHAPIVRPYNHPESPVSDCRPIRREEDEVRRQMEIDDRRREERLQQEARDDVQASWDND